MGRPLGDKARSLTITMRVTGAEAAEIEQAAGPRRLSAFTRQTVLQAVRTAKTPATERDEGPSRAHAGSPSTDDVYEEPETITASLMVTTRTNTITIHPDGLIVAYPKEN